MKTTKIYIKNKKLSSITSTHHRTLRSDAKEKKKYANTKSELDK